MSRDREEPEIVKEAARRRRLEVEREAQQTLARRRRLLTGGWVGLAAAVAVIAVVALSGGHSSSARGSAGRTIDAIQCQSNEQVLFHIHAHVAIYVDGRPRTVPAGIGIAPPRSVQRTSDGPFVVGGSCFYWLHSHTADGVIHIESPVRRTYTLGDYFDVWGKALGRDRVGSARGPVGAYVDGRPYRGDPRAIPLTAHTLVQLDVGPRVAPRPFRFPVGL